MPKSCDLRDGRCIDCGGDGSDCPAEASLDELRMMEAGETPRRAVRVTAVQAAALYASPVLTLDDIAELDRTLVGNRIEALTKAIGIPPCGGCGDRRDWLNRAHLWLRGN